jgi:hypothetical protein
LKATLGPLADLQMGSVLQKNLEVYLQRAICWQDGELAKMQAAVTLGYKGAVIFSAIEDVRCMYLAPEPEVPEEIRSLQRIRLDWVKDQDDLNRLVTELNVESFRRGQKSTK